MKAFVTVDEMSRIDRETIEGLNGDSFQLMQRVAEEAAEVLSMHPDFVEPALVFCGPGNNGGDGYCLAEYLRREGFKVAVVSAVEPSSKDSKEAFRFYKGAKVSPSQWRSFKPKTIVDAIFGLNGKSQLEVSITNLIKDLNQSSAFRVSIDVPSGLSLREQKAGPFVFESDLTLCVGYPKTPFLKSELAEHLGEVILLARAFPKSKSSDLWMLEKSDFSFVKQKRVSHKGTFGKAAIIGGSPSMPGAAMLAAEAAARVGAGYSTLFFAEGGSLKLEVSKASFIFKQKWKNAELFKQAAWALGCGGLPKKMPPFSQWKSPVVLDAEVFSRWKKKDFAALKKLKKPCLLTPHAGEAAKILKWDRQQIEAAPIRACEAIVELTGQSCYLKGAPSYLIFSDGALRDSKLLARRNMTYVNLSINPVFAKAGSGDILSGILCGFLAQRPENFVEAVISGVVFQNQLGEVLRKRRGLISSDQLTAFDLSFKRLRTL